MSARSDTKGFLHPGQPNIISTSRKNNLEEKFDLLTQGQKNTVRSYIRNVAKGKTPADGIVEANKKLEESLDKNEGYSDQMKKEIRDYVKNVNTDIKSKAYKVAIEKEKVEKKQEKIESLKETIKTLKEGSKEQRAAAKEKLAEQKEILVGKIKKQGIKRT